MSPEEKRLAIRVSPFVIVIWLIFLFGFKTEFGFVGDESGYHDGGVFLARSLANGTFLADALNPDLFKYPGYYGLAGIFYFLFGEHSLMLRALGLLPLLGLAVVVANTSALVSGERARNFGYLAVLFAPVLLFFSLQLYRDIFVVFAIAVVLHRTIAVTQLNLGPKFFVTYPVIGAFVLIFFFRSPQVFITAVSVIVTYAISWALSLSVRKRGPALIALFSLVFLGGLLAADMLLQIVQDNYFTSSQREDVTISTYTALSSFSFASPRDMLVAFTNPAFVAKALILKLTGFALGPHPFSEIEGSGSILNLFGSFQPADWGNYRWEDVLLVYGLQWLPHWMFLPFLIAGLIGLWRFNVKALIALATVWLLYAGITLFTANETRWGLPMVLVYYVIVAIGYAWYAGRITQYWFVGGALFVSVIAVRMWFFPVPMIVVPLALLVLMLIAKPLPIGFSARSVKSQSVAGVPGQPAKRL
jgi:hypothetical protein